MPNNVEWMNKLCYIHIVEYYLATRMNKTIAIFNNMDEPLKHTVKQKTPKCFLSGWII